MASEPQTAPAAPAGYGNVSMTTKRGRLVRIRHISSNDAPLLIDLFQHLSARTRWLRFFTTSTVPLEKLQQEAIRLSNIDPQSEAALVACVQEERAERLVGVARLASDPAYPGMAEVAVVVRDDYQNEGIGSFLLDLLIQVALVRGFKLLRGHTLAENAIILQMARRSGFPFSIHTSHGETTIEIRLSDTS